MANKKTWLGILVMILVFGCSLTGCDEIENNGGGGSDYTFEFKVQCGYLGGHIT